MLSIVQRSKWGLVGALFILAACERTRDADAGSGPAQTEVEEDATTPRFELSLRGLSGWGLTLGTDATQLTVAPEAESVTVEGTAASLTLLGQPTRPAQRCSLEVAENTASVDCTTVNEAPCEALLASSAFPMALSESADLLALVTESLPRPVFTHLTPLPGQADVLLALSLDGYVYRVDLSATVPAVTLALQVPATFVANHENIAVAIKASPDFESDGLIYLVYTTDVGDETAARLARFKSLDSGLNFDPGSQKVLIEAPGIHRGIAHAGGDIAFDDEGKLIVILGDGGGFSIPPSAEAQDNTRLLGTAYRIDPDEGSPAGYTVPADNPFASVTDGSVRQEIWATGLRNPFRSDWDTEQQALWVGDVGEYSFEELNLVRRGENYGWPYFEGPRVTPDLPPVPDGDYVDPVFSYGREFGASITAGYRYGGTALAGYEGAFLFADFAQPKVYALVDPLSAPTPVPLAQSPEGVVAIEADLAGEPWVLTLSGKLYRLQQSATAALPDTLRATGCVDSESPFQLDPHFFEYDLNAPLWSDDAVKRRYAYVPEGASVELRADGDFNFPEGSVLVKTFEREGRPLEVRFLYRAEGGQWGAISYAYGDDGGARPALAGERLRDGEGVFWSVPSQGQCFSCHTSAAGFSLGAESRQLGGQHAWRAEASRDQLALWRDLRVLPDEAALPETVFASLEDEEASLGDRARAYLHANCSSCHRPGGTAPTSLDFRFDASLQARGCAEGDALAPLVPGQPELSELLQRMQTVGTGAMPPLARERVDAEAVALVRRWITSLNSCAAE